MSFFICYFGMKLVKLNYEKSSLFLFVMRKIFYWLILVAGRYLIYRIADVYWMLAFIGIFLAFGVTLIKLPLSDALRLWGFVIFFMVMMLGGAVILARQWSKFAAGVWIFIWIILLMVFQNKI